jgi:hypothetical protein
LGFDVITWGWQRLEQTVLIFLTRFDRRDNQFLVACKSPLQNKDQQGKANKAAKGLKEEAIIDSTEHVLIIIAQE